MCISAQAVEHLNAIQEVSRSIPLSPPIMTVIQVVYASRKLYIVAIVL